MRIAARAAAAAALAALALVPAAAAAPIPGPNETIQCGPDERWCSGAFLKHGRRFLDLSGWDLRGRYRLCVTPPRARERCKAFPLRPTDTGAHGSSIAFARHFPHARSGRYRVRWIYGGRQLGRVLAFRV